MNLSAWMMFGFGCLVLYGGLIICLVIAFRKRNIVEKKSQTKIRSEK
jgi:hypothetical protein